MKSVTRTVLSTTLTDATSYSSGPLDVGDLFELAIDFHVTEVTGATGYNGYPSMHISRIGASGDLHEMTTVGPLTGDASVSLGAGLALNFAFGDQIQLDLVVPASQSISTTISIKGKG